MLLTIEIIGIITMIILSSVSVLSFIMINKILSQLKYRNYLMEKMTQNIYMIASKKDKETYNKLFDEYNDTNKDECKDKDKNKDKSKI
ncbi:hypothetical protein [Clostridium algidicarnis]|uniref:hypothetical protein n=1 Tax=Clostridium algidicarnis TaxID=37659 RepID=UPI001C0D0912|nr:hypothetical protein [Clostridium algidicarnis]MBU3204563.1 hypothetical protein [Clostridium algidicarnis]MBU3212353.1 hypothetical protein [Clostridium algidicarnis]MBU3222785.1 hypothetical protein [Clostridium algidicarnis]